MLKKLLKNIINQAGYTLYKDTENPHNPFVIQRKLLDGSQPVTIFDVGANHGHTVAMYKTLFPNSSIYAFEPHPEAYARLVQSAGRLKDVHTFEMALGSREGKASFYMNTFSETSSLLENSPLGKQIWGEGAMTPAGSMQVAVSTLDDFMRKHAIPAIDILKLDTQGTEYQIIEGGAGALAEGKVKVIYTEIITLPTYNSQEKIYKVMEGLYDYSFRLHGIYNQYYVNKKLASLDAIFTREDT